MHDILDRLVEKINSANIDLMPSDNIYMEDVFTHDIYQELIARLPHDDQYHFINHPDATLPDGTITRKLLDLSTSSIQKLNQDDQRFWQDITNVMTSKDLVDAIMQKFSNRMNEKYNNVWPEMVPVPILYRDYPGYRIGVHTDAPFKLATMQFYLPKNLSQIHLGTSFHLRRDNQFILLKTNPFKPNAAYAFARTEESWHSVNQLASHESKRDSLALTIYLKGHEYNSEKETKNDSY